MTAMTASKRAKHSPRENALDMADLFFRIKHTPLPKANV